MITIDNDLTQASPMPMCFSLKLHKSKMSNFLIQALNTYPSSSNQYTCHLVLRNHESTSGLPNNS